MKDLYLQNPELLKGQPKKTIGDYVAQNGVLVPRRFESIKEARESGLPFIARSEHPQDYDGCSGLFVSPVSIYDSNFCWDHTEDDFLASVLDYQRTHKFGDKGDIPKRLEQYCSFLKTDFAKFMRKLSYSFWELIDGFNLSVTADSAIKDKYHFTVEGVCYTAIENNAITTHLQYNKLPGLPLSFVNEFKPIIKLYEQVRSLNHFAANHCPIMEFQVSVNTGKAQIYFLQYHRTRDFDQVDFELKNRSSLDHITLENVRGKTSSEGIDCKVVVEYGYQSILGLGVSKNNWQISGEEQGVINDPVYFNPNLDEIMSRRSLFDLRAKSFFSLITHHYCRSLWFKPQVSAIDDYSVVEELLPTEEQEEAWKKAKATGETQYINLHVVCDGRKAHVKRI